MFYERGARTGSVYCPSGLAFGRCVRYLTDTSDHLFYCHRWQEPRPVGPVRLSTRNRVFVVDDDASMLKSVARLLRQLGYAGLLFPSAEAFANHGDFDSAVCVLLDINLGDVSGIELRAPSQGSECCRADYLHDGKRYAGRS